MVKGKDIKLGQVLQTYNVQTQSLGWFRVDGIRPDSDTGFISVTGLFEGAQRKSTVVLRWNTEYQTK